MKRRIMTFLCMLVLGAAVITGCGADNEKAENKPAGETVEKGETQENLEGHTLMIYCGAGMQKPFQEIAEIFQEKTGCEMNVTYANAGQIQSQITTAQEGDMFIAGSVDELKPVEEYVTDYKDLVKHIPVLVAAEGNPKGIEGLASLTGEGISMVMGDAEATPIGKIAKKALTDAGIFDEVNIIATTATAPQLATVIAGQEADAAIIWKENSQIDGVTIIDTQDLQDYIKTIPAAVLSCTSDADAGSIFYEFLNSDAAKEIWMKYGYEIIA